MTRLLANRWISIAVRLALGALFIDSAWPKLADPPAFAQMLSNYRLLPGAWINPAALVLPWLEMVSGICLVAGIARRGAALWIGLLLFVFIGAVSINIARGVAVDCGCFSVTASRKSHAEMIASMKLDVARDLGMLFMAVFTFFSPVAWRKPPGPDPETKSGMRGTA
jgi:uncharacterized membrane protein YphA (DoxX/SURF4 family)